MAKKVKYLDWMEKAPSVGALDYNLYLKYNPPVVNSLMKEKAIAAGLVITPAPKAIAIPQKEGRIAVDMNNFEERLFLECSE